MKLATCLFLMFMSTVASAQHDAALTNQSAIRLAQQGGPANAPCPDRRKLRNLCMMVGNQIRDDKNPKRFLHETRIYEASCVDESKDSAAVRNEKIRKMWSMYEAELKCDNTQFDVADGHLLKYAVSSKFDDFIDDVISWKVNLNRVDPADNRTVLDYVKYHLDKNKGNALESKLQNYYNKLRAAGARHKSEL